MGIQRNSVIMELPLTGKYQAAQYGLGQHTSVKRVIEADPLLQPSPVGPTHIPHLYYPLVPSPGHGAQAA
jgi:hypothetical protein